MRLQLHKLAEREIEAAARWYRGRAENLDMRFLASVREAFDKLETEAPRFAKLETEPEGSTFHRVRVVGFPYIVVFEVLADVVFVYAVAHTSRRPGYWRRRRRRNS